MSEVERWFADYVDFAVVAQVNEDDDFDADVRGRSSLYDDDDFEDDDEDDEDKDDDDAYDDYDEDDDWED